MVGRGAGRGIGRAQGGANERTKACPRKAARATAPLQRPDPPDPACSCLTVSLHSAPKRRTHDCMS